MKSYTFQDGGSNAFYYWGYINEYRSAERIIWVAGVGPFTKTGRAVINDFGDLVEVV